LLFSCFLSHALRWDFRPAFEAHTFWQIWQTHAEYLSFPVPGGLGMSTRERLLAERGVDHMGATDRRIGEPKDGEKQLSRTDACPSDT